MRIRLCVLATILGTMVLILMPPGRASLHATTLEIGIDENMFTVNGVDKFLVFVSYFDAMDVNSTNLHSDFAYLKSKGVDGVRIFPNWWDIRSDVWNANPTYYYSGNTLFAPNGTIRSTRLSTFLNVLDIAKQEGLLVDVSFSAETVASCVGCSGTLPSGDYITFNDYASAIGSITTTLANAGSSDKHVLFDLQNEYNLNGPGGAGSFSNSQILSIRNTVKSNDPDRIVTASISHDVAAGTAATREVAAGVDAIAWHETRNNGFWNLVDDAITAIHSAESDPPIYLQEPPRLEKDSSVDNTSWLTAAGFGADVRGAYVNGAAAWCFHTGGASTWTAPSCNPSSSPSRRRS